MTRHLAGMFAAAIGTVALAMTTQPVAGAQSQAPPAGDTQTGRASANQQVTVTGCVQREADYRQSVGAGRAGVAGTGLGAGNEFVLTNATMSTATRSTPAATSGAGAPAATGTAGAENSKAYELTGSHEGDAAALVGKKVEVTGTMKPMATTPGGPTANVPGSRDLKLQELEVSSIRATTGTCPATAAP